jgi:putative FmdB family regulatory protein
MLNSGGGFLFEKSEHFIKGGVLLFMPIYEYECCECGLCFERRQRFDEEPVSLCSECQGKARRRLHSVAVIYKGSGFYTTDSRKSTPVEDTPKEAGKETKPEKPGTGGENKS